MYRGKIATVLLLKSRPLEENTRTRPSTSPTKRKDECGTAYRASRRDRKAFQTVRRDFCKGFVV